MIRKKYITPTKWLLASAVAGLLLGCGDGSSSADGQAAQIKSAEPQATAASAVAVTGDSVTFDNQALTPLSTGNKLSAATAFGTTKPVSLGKGQVVALSSLTAASTQAKSAYAVSNKRGTSAADIPPALGQCASINTDVPYTAPTPGASTAYCYQFVVNSLAKMDVQVALPTGISGTTYLYEVDPATGQLPSTTLDQDTTANPVMLLQTVNQYVRLVLVVVANNGAGGQAFQLGAFTRTSTPDQYEPNDKPNHPSIISMNGTVNANIDVPGIDQDYYFYPLGTNQTSAQIKAVFSSNIGISFRLAQQASPTSYLVGTEYSIPATGSGSSYNFTGLPSNTAGTPQFGILFRAAGINPAAGAGEGYSVRAGILNSSISKLFLSNVEYQSQLSFSLFASGNMG